MAGTFILVSCGAPQRQQATVEAEKGATVTIPIFNADSAFYFIQAQVDFGPMVPNTPEHIACAEYLAATLERFGAEVIVQKAQVRAFDNTVLNIRNIIGKFQPELKNRILLFAHWDTRPFADHDPNPALHNVPILGANDGGSGVGVLLEIARHLREYPTTLGVDIIFFDAEDYGTPDHIPLPYIPDTWGLGSQYWGKNPHRDNYHARFGINLCMVGARDALFFKEQHSMQFAPDLKNRVWDTARELGYSKWFNTGRGGMIINDHYYVFRYRGIPSINIIQFEPTSRTSFGHFWHTHADNMDIIDRGTLKAVGHTVMEVIYNER